jgi:hypothetical protein
MLPAVSATAAADEGEDMLAGIRSRAVNSHRPGLIPAARSRPACRRARIERVSLVSAIPASAEIADDALPRIGAAGCVVVERGAGIAGCGSAEAAEVAGPAVFSGSTGRTGVIGFSAGAAVASIPASSPPAKAIITYRGPIISPRVAAPAFIQPLRRGLVPRAP